jgi:hypothetical protein
MLWFDCLLCLVFSSIQDNVAARLFVDDRCVTNLKPLLESGTLAAKGLRVVF